MTFFSGEAVYRRIADDLRAKIRDGRLLPGQQLPSIAVLMREYDVSQTVVKAALAELKTSGDVFGHQGKGTFVRTERPARRIRRIPRPGGTASGSTFTAEMGRLGLTPSTKLAEVGKVAAPLYVARLLELDENAHVLIRKRQMFGSDQPVQLATAYIPMDVAGDESIAFPDTGPTGMYERLERRGHRPVRFTEEIEVRRPDREEHDFLRLPEGVPVLVVARSAFDTDDRPVEGAYNVLAANQWRLLYEWREDST